MAVCCRGMTTAETAALTFAMMRSGETWDLSPHGFVADKHSTGGVGDKVTLVLAPLLAAVGVKSGMMSGRGLGHTGGTLDKLEAIPGFRTALPKADFDRLLETVGCALDRPDRLGRAGGPATLRPPRRDGDGRVDPAHHGVDPLEEVRDRRPRRRLRREERERRLHGGPGGRRHARKGAGRHGPRRRAGGPRAGSPPWTARSARRSGTRTRWKSRSGCSAAKGRPTSGRSFSCSAPTS